MEYIRHSIRYIKHGTGYIKHGTKVKFHPRRGHEGSQGEYKYYSTLSLTSALDVGGWLTPRPGHFTPGKETR
jgi:hypothetical protein